MELLRLFERIGEGVGIPHLWAEKPCCAVLGLAVGFKSFEGFVASTPTSASTRDTSSEPAEMRKESHGRETIFLSRCPLLH
jgi:hypothetical protein